MREKTTFFYFFQFLSCSDSDFFSSLERSHFRVSLIAYDLTDCIIGFVEFENNIQFFSLNCKFGRIFSSAVLGFLLTLTSGSFPNTGHGLHTTQSLLKKHKFGFIVVYKIRIKDGMFTYLKASFNSK